MRRVVLPDSLAEQAREYAAGAREPAEPRDAATVLLLRDGPSGVESYLLRRRASMAFAAGMYVFPGGSVDPRDSEPPAWTGPPPSAWAARLGVDDDHASALVCAAVRETFEEAGVLLAGPNDTSVVDDTTSADWEQDREALVAHDLALSELLQRRGLVLRSDLLGVWSGWTTPVFEPRRYRTWFFVAALPAGQRARDVSTESDTVTWQPVTTVLEDGDAGRIGLMPPTYLNLLDVSRCPTVDDVLTVARERTVRMFMPELEDGGTLSVPPGFEDLLG